MIFRKDCPLDNDSFFEAFKVLKDREHGNQKHGAILQFLFTCMKQHEDYDLTSSILLGSGAISQKHNSFLGAFAFNDKAPVLKSINQQRQAKNNPLNLLLHTWIRKKQKKNSISLNNFHHTPMCLVLSCFVLDLTRLKNKTKTAHLDFTSFKQPPAEKKKAHSRPVRVTSRKTEA